MIADKAFFVIIANSGSQFDVKQLEVILETKIVLISSRKNTGFEALKTIIANYQNLSLKPCLNSSKIAPEYFDRIQKTFPNQIILQN